MERKGIVYNIQRFSTHDGPGIRTTVFLKGCPLSCFWCGNPESQSRKSQLMTRDLKCKGCGECLKACSEGAVRFDDQGKRIVDWHKCNHCFDCVKTCVYGAMTSMGDSMTAAEIVETVEKDQVFYKNSGGGVTISGGEPLGQPDFLEELLVLLKQTGLHVALDTTGHAPASVLDRILPLVDLVLFDIKHLDSNKHKETTGVGNDLILENAARVAREVRTWFRIPLMAGFNDDEQHIRQLAKLASDSGVEKVSLLPFHEGGEAKISQIGLDHPDFFLSTPSDEHVEYLSQLLAEAGIAASIRS